MVAHFTQPALQGFWEHYSQKVDFNRNQFLGLCRDTDEETVLKIASLFCETLSLSLGDINLAVDNKNADIVWQRAHKIASTAELLGFSPLGQFSRNLSHQVKAHPSTEDHLSEINEYVGHIQILHDELTRLIKKT